MNIDKETLETVKKVLKAYAPETINSALGYTAFIAPIKSLSDEEQARIMAEVQKAVNKRAREIFEEES